MNMKNIRNIISGMLALLFVTTILGSCQTDDYLVDGGKSNPYYDGTIMEYLESRDDMLFSDLVKVIKMTKWYDVFSDENADVTFFAPTDFSIDKSVDMLNYYLYNWNNMEKITDLSQVKSEVWEDMIGMYVLEGKYRLNDIAQIDTVALSAFPGQTNYTYDKKYKLTMGVCYGDANGIKYAGYRQIMCASQDYGAPIYAYVSSCNIEPHNGIVHVLRLDHSLGFNSYTLYSKAMEAGIDYPDNTRQGRDLLIGERGNSNNMLIINEESYE